MRRLELGATSAPHEARADRTAARAMGLCTPFAGRQASITPAPGPLPDGLDSSIRELPTQPMPTELRSIYEPRFDRSFADVQFSTGAEAESVAAQIGARAFAVGSTIGFGRSAYEPNSLSGRWLLAHELAHVSEETSEPGGIVRRSPPTEELARDITGELLDMSKEDAVSRIGEFDDEMLLMAIRNELIAHQQLFGSNTGEKDHIEFLFATLDARAHAVVNAFDAFINDVRAIRKSKDKTLQAGEKARLKSLLGLMTVDTIKRVEKELLI